MEETEEREEVYIFQPVCIIAEEAETPETM